MHRERLLQMLIEQTPDYAFLLIDKDGLICWMNPAAERIFGISCAAAAGKSASTFFTPEDVRDGLEVTERLTAEVAPSASDDRWLMRADGTRFWAAGVLTSLRDGDGNTVAYGKILRNRTDQREHVEALKNQLQKADTDITRNDEFLSTLSHELRNPLAPLQHAIEIIRMSVPPSNLSAPVDILERQVAQLRRLVEDLLDLSRVKHGKMAANLAEIDICNVVRRSVDSVQPEITRKSHRTHILLPPTPMIVAGDGQRLEQVFVNLLTNAAKYTLRSGDIWIKGTVEGDDAVISVQDSGVGIPAERLTDIFNLFTQVDPSSVHAGGGLGIGLALVAQLVSLHGGYVHARSDGPGKGSEFVVRLPLLKREGS